MPSSCDAIADGILNTRTLLARYLAGFDDTNHTRQAPGLPNHVAWCLGHLALTMSRCDEKITGKAPPASDFGAKDGPGQFATESVAFGSTPHADPGAYPGLKRCVEIYNGACERLGATYRALPESRLKDSVDWGTMKMEIGPLGLRMVFHNGMHCGQISDLRRVMGLKSIFA